MAFMPGAQSATANIGHHSTFECGNARIAGSPAPTPTHAPRRPLLADSVHVDSPCEAALACVPVMKHNVAFGVNGDPVNLDVDDDRALLWVLRTELRLTGTKYGCGEGL
jgi:hypothetical protein